MSHQDRWKQEQEFFDQEEYSTGPLPQAVIDRYIACRKPFLPAEFPFAVLGDIRGKRVLEIGCGDGANSILLALKGAEVVGIDISPRAIEIATERASLHQVSDRVTFYAEPLEVYLEKSGGAKFDIICGFAVLHHVLPVLDSVLKDLKALSGPHTAFVFVEPVALSPALRRLRLALPIPTHATPDERPLEERDLAIIDSVLPGMHSRTFGMLTRVWHRFLGANYEGFSPAKRSLYDVAARLDRIFLGIPALQVLGSTMVLYTANGK